MMEANFSIFQSI
nr:unnamed protein product [Callosobruchus chinensis]